MSEIRSEEFRLISGKKKIKRKTNVKVNLQICKTDLQNSNEDVHLRKITQLQQEIKASKFFQHFTNCLEEALLLLKASKIGKLVCLGLGTFTNCPAALHQLAFILEVQQSLSIHTAEFYDPVHSENEKNLLRKLNCNLMAENCEGKYAVDCLTLFYLPHCPKQLINNLLWQNWDRNLLRNSILICNSFEKLKSNTPERFLRHDAEYVLRIFEFTKELPLDTCYKYSDVFNDTSIHIFPIDVLKDLQNDFWQKGGEPVYSDMELITCKMEENLEIR